MVNEELREALERTIHAGVVRQWQGPMRADVALTDPRPIVREILALPEVAALLAHAERVARVRALAEEATRRLDWHIMVIHSGEARYVPLDRLLHALNGGQS